MLAGLGLLLVYTLCSLVIQHLVAPRSAHIWNKGVLKSAKLTGHSWSDQSTAPTLQPPPRYIPGRPVVSSSNTSRPPLSTLVRDDEIVGDVQFLLDFAIVGFGKAGTTTMMDWLAAHPQIAIFSREVYQLVNQQPAKLVQELYQDLPSDHGILRGYKNPLEISQKHVMEYYRKYWPHTKLLIGVRHPILWFESLYNFRVQNLPPDQEMPDPNHLIGRCYSDRRNTCTEKGNFAYFLMNLGKTNGRSASSSSSNLTESIVGSYKSQWFNVSEVPYLSNPVFLYHLEEMQDSPNQLAVAVRDFLGLSSDLPPLPHRKPGFQIVDEAIRRDKEEQKIDICHAMYKPLREELLRMGTLGAQWIDQEFLPSSSTIHVTDAFVPILSRWAVDPCTTTRKNAATIGGLRNPLRHDPVIRAALPLHISFQGQ